MTASKKLKKLKARLSPAGLAGLVETVDSYEAKQELACVLPQIVAVVEAAEQTARFSDKRGVACQVALAALEEALG